VEAIIRPWRLAGVVKALSDGGIRGVTTYEVKGLGAQGGARERYLGHEFDDASLVDKTKVEVVIVASQVNDVVNIIVQAAQVRRRVMRWRFTACSEHTVPCLLACTHRRARSATARFSSAPSVTSFAFARPSTARLRSA
jgi:nitrogen regulatory protein PII